MRKFSYFIAAFAAALGTVLFFLRQSAWFASEQAKHMSEPAEIVESAFWASIILFGIGLLLFLLSFRRKNREADEIEDPAPLEPEPWICPYCGSANDDALELCPVCGTPRTGTGEWVCPRCANVMPPETPVCTVCGSHRVQ